MNKKVAIALSSVAVVAVVSVGFAFQSDYFSGSFRPLSGPLSAPCSEKPLSVPGRPVSGETSPCQRKPLSSRPVPSVKIYEAETHKYIAPNVPVEKKIQPVTLKQKVIKFFYR